MSSTGRAGGEGVGGRDQTSTTTPAQKAKPSAELLDGGFAKHVLAGFIASLMRPSSKEDVAWRASPSLLVLDARKQADRRPPQASCRTELRLIASTAAPGNGRH